MTERTKRLSLDLWRVSTTWLRLPSLSGLTLEDTLIETSSKFDPLSHPKDPGPIRSIRGFWPEASRFSRKICYHPLNTTIFYKSA